MEGTFDDYLGELAKKGAWMGAMEVGALAKANGLVPRRVSTAEETRNNPSGCGITKNTTN